MLLICVCYVKRLIERLTILYMGRDKYCTPSSTIYLPIIFRRYYVRNMVYFSFDLHLSDQYKEVIHRD